MPSIRANSLSRQCDDVIGGGMIATERLETVARYQR